MIALLAVIAVGCAAILASALTFVRLVDGVVVVLR